MEFLCRFLDTIDFLFTQGNVWKLHGTYACMTLHLGNTRQGVKLQSKRSFLNTRLINISMIKIIVASYLTSLDWLGVIFVLGLNVYFLDLMISISLVLLLHWIIQGNACANNLCLFTWNCLGGPALWNGLVALWVQRFLQRSRHGLWVQDYLDIMKLTLNCNSNLGSLHMCFDCEPRLAEAFKLGTSGQQICWSWDSSFWDLEEHGHVSR